MKKAVTGIFNKIPRKTNSHGYGWARTWSENLDIPINHDAEIVDVLYMDHGVNFGGSLNLFAGFTEDLKQRIDNMMQSSEIFSLDRPMPEYGEMLKKRKDVHDKKWCDEITSKLMTAKTLISSDLDKDWLAVGDSHTAAYSRIDSSVVKQDGTTLNGQCNSNFSYLKQHIDKRKWKGVTISLGNIDVRHHLCRISADWKPLYDKMFAFGDSLGCNVEYSVPWPIEYEERRLPKTGQYRNQNFWGTREQRAELVNDIYEYMANRVNIVRAPQAWYDMNPKQYAESRMEGTSSVHLNPLFYRRMNWGIEQNSVNLESFFV